ncbi:MAG TPA: helix-turn-helix transcriptional regulator [Mycobacterium sp.]|nr:helix-turn-helix transcriptional regulator [Mycobacterium sp.]
MPRPRRPVPRAHVVSGDWPHAKLDGEPATEVGQALAARLAEAVAGLSLREVQARTGVDHNTVDNVLQGRAWPDLITIARLENGLDVDLWPGRLRKPGRKTSPHKTATP